MAQAFEQDQSGKRQSLADLIANIEAQATPYTSMLDKRTRPAQKKHDWQVKHYPVTGHAGVPDGQPAQSFNSNPRDTLSVIGQKTWYNPAVSDFAEETEIAGAKKGEMAEQVTDALISVKRQIEKRCLSNIDTCAQGNGNAANETRGTYSWHNPNAQANYPVPADFRTPVSSVYTDTLANFKEDTFISLANSSYKQRNGAFKMDGFVGIDLKTNFAGWSKYQDNVNNKTPVRRFNQDQGDKMLINVIDRLVLDSGEIDLHLSTFMLTDRLTGAPTASTHISGIFQDMDMAGIAYTRLPRVVMLPYDGGGEKAIVDAIFLHMVDNPLGGIMVTPSGN